MPNVTKNDMKFQITITKKIVALTKSKVKAMLSLAAQNQTWNEKLKTNAGEACISVFCCCCIT